jgi:hypothetical protein
MTARKKREVLFEIIETIFNWNIENFDDYCNLLKQNLKIKRNINANIFYLYLDVLFVFN